MQEPIQLPREPREERDQPAEVTPPTPLTPSTLAATAAATTGGGALTRAQFEKLTTDGLIDYLAANEVALSDKVKDILREQEIDGDGLTGMTKDELVAAGVPVGAASKIVKRIPQ